MVNSTKLKGKGIGHITIGIPTKKVSCDRCGKKVFYSKLHKTSGPFGDLICDECYYG